jgi:2-phosphoglycerate kinase
MDPIHGGCRQALRAQLRHVRFIGGATRSGKSTVARRLAAEHGLRLHEIEPYSRYLARSTPDEAPLLHAFVAMDMDERWLNRHPRVMRDTFHGFHGESFPLVLADLLALKRSSPVLVEGFSLRPRLVAPLLSHRHQAVWLVATAAFRRAKTTYDIAQKTSNPPLAQENLLERDRLFAEDVVRETAALGLPVLEVDVGTSVDELTTRVSAALALS